MILPEYLLIPSVLGLILISGWASTSKMRTLFLSVLFLSFCSTFLAGSYLNELFVIDGFVKLCQGLMIGVTFWIYITDQSDIAQSEMILLLLALLGASLLIMATSWIGFFVGLELMALPTYALCCLDKEAASSEAALKYFVMGVIASIFILYGISFIYIVTGSLQYVDMLALNTSAGLYSQIGAVLLFSGLFFKLGLAPFHHWVPDVYQGVRVRVVYWISIVPKLAVMGALVRILAMTNLQELLVVKQMLLLVGGLSIAYGVLMAIRQQHIRRLIAYASIMHMGVAILPLVINDLSSAFIYLSGYLLITLVAFYIITNLSSRGVESVDALTGYAKQYPYESFAFLLCMAAMAGIPPLVGFMIKLNVFYVLLSSGYILTTLWAILFIAISAYYYIKVIQKMYFHTKGEVVLERQYKPLVLSLILLGVGIMPQPFIMSLSKVIGGIV